MIRLFDAETDEPLGTITEAQLEFLMDEMEEESSIDRDYYINGATIDMLEERGADPELITLLREALGDRDEMEVRWEGE
jgi:processive 1,2-diacylglycerol beta-glucosyltransferase